MIIKMFTVVFYGVTAIVVALLVRLFYILFTIRRISQKNEYTTAKTLIILGSGGHTTEMLKIIEKLDVDKYTPRIYIHGQTDKMSLEKLHQTEENNKDWKIVPIFRSREVGQSYLTSIVTTLIAFKDAMCILFMENPDLILCNGPGTGVPLCLGAFLMRLLFISKTKVIFIESFCRVKTFSLTGNMTSRTLLSSVEIPWDVLMRVCNEQIPEEIRIHLVPMCNVLHSNVESQKNLESSTIEDLSLIIDACIDRTWEELNTGHWKDVSIQQRYCYTVCSILKCIILEMNSDKINPGTVMREMIEQIDKGLLLGAPLEDAPDILTDMASQLNEQFSKSNDESASDNEDVSKFDFGNVSKKLLEGLEWVKRYDTPSMETFYRDIFMPKTPAVLSGCIDHWKALTLWKDPNYLIKIAGSRTVPIELGSSYTEEDWSQKLITFSKFIRSHVTKSNAKIGYLAQHPLFDQIPALKDDFSVPDYCNFSDDPNGTSPNINAWFGPGGTVSPLHYDPKDNLLCQVFGYKQVILYSPDDGPYLYPYDTRLLSNTAQVNPINLDYEKFPEFKKAKGYMCYIEPGEMLYIPPKWWHHVTSLTPSFSISFWWN